MHPVLAIHHRIRTSWISIATSSPYVVTNFDAAHRISFPRREPRISSPRQSAVPRAPADFFNGHVAPHHSQSFPKDENESEKQLDKRTAILHQVGQCKVGPGEFVAYFKLGAFKKTTSKVRSSG
jgi:hypothetical protein